MAAHSIKLNRSLDICKFLPMQRRAILESVPTEIIANLRASDLALVMQALDAHWHKAVAFAEKQILAEGCIWDGTSLREIADGQPGV